VAPSFRKTYEGSFQTKLRNVTIIQCIQCYAATEKSVAFAKQTLYRLLYETTKKTCETNITLLFKQRTFFHIVPTIHNL